MKCGMRWQSVSTWMMKLQSSPALAQLDDPVEDRLPVLVAGEIVVGDEEGLHALRQIGADDDLDVVGAAMARLAALHIDDGAEGALERAAASGVETGHPAAGAADHFRRQDRRRGSFDGRQVVHVIVERLEFAIERVAQHGVEPAFRLAGEQAASQRLRLAQICGRLRQHGEAARHVEAADGDGDAAAAKAPRQVEGARKLVRLHADEFDEARARRSDGGGDFLGSYAGVGLVTDRCGRCRRSFGC